MCKNSEQCRYAHGVSEIRKFKTNSDSDDNKEDNNFKSNKKINNSKKLSYSNDSVSLSDCSIISDESSYENKNIIQSPAKLRYNYLNPFFFYSINNFPIQNYVNDNTTMPFFNYITSETKYMGNVLKSNKTNLSDLTTQSNSGTISRQQPQSKINTNIMSPLKKGRTALDS